MSTSSNLSARPLQTRVDDQYKDWFLRYASYVILERAIPAIDDGLKPVQRRILHAMKEMDDGRFNKVANIIGQSMQYHPHGDASIGDALVNMGQKNYFIETQGNWGDVRTGDQAAASRYIEARLSKLAKKIIFQPQLTEWQKSYDGRKNEPVVLPVKFPLVLLHGAEGIAVGLSTKILPHNFNEICEAATRYLKGKPISLLPDFASGGMIDVTNYNQGERGGKVKVRARIEEKEKGILLVKDVPFSVTTSQLIDSIVKAGELGKINVKKITDNTAQEVEVMIETAKDVTSSQSIDALYSFTKCQVSISPNACVVAEQKPRFMNVHDILTFCVDRTRSLFRKELQIALELLGEQWHYISLEKIFFEQQLYKELEKKHKAWEEVLEAIQTAFQPYQNQLKKPIVQEDIQKLIEKPVRRIYKLDIKDLENKLTHIISAIEEKKKHLKDLTAYTIAWFDELKKEFGGNYERRTAVQEFYEKRAEEVAIANTKLYMNAKEGFVGTALKKDQYITDCSDVDLVLAISKKGVMKVFKVSDKVFVDKQLIHVELFQRNGKDERAYSMLYVDGTTGNCYAKRFTVGGITRNKAYHITQKNPHSRILYFVCEENEGVNELLITISPNCKARHKSITFDFSQLSVGSKLIRGNQVTKYPIYKVRLQKKITSAPSSEAYYYDPFYGRIHKKESGSFLGEFAKKDTLLFLFCDGTAMRSFPEDDQIVDVKKTMRIQKYAEGETITAVYQQLNKIYYIKRFVLESMPKEKRVSFLSSTEPCDLVLVTTNPEPLLRINIGKKKDPIYVRIRTNQMTPVMGMAALGKAINTEKPIKEIHWVE